MDNVDREMRTVLVVEDNEDDRYLLGRAADQSVSSVACHFVANVDEAKAYLKGSGRFSDRINYPLPDLLLLDLMLPKEDGLSLLKWIRCSPVGRPLKVCVWTGSSDPRLTGEAKRLGANWLIQKTTEPEHFSGVVSQLARIGGFSRAVASLCV